MRDLTLLAILPFLVYAIAKRPFIGIGLWIWTALFFPNAWVYGPAANLRYNLLFTSVAILSYVVMKHKPKFVLGALGSVVLFFFVWTTLSTVLTIGLPERSWDIWSRFAKVITLFVFILLVIEKKLHVDFVLWCVVLSVGFYANLEALKFIVTGGGHKIEGIYGHVLGDRNELSVAFVMTLPICYYLLEQYKEQSRIIALGILATMGLIVAAVVGTQSRGGFIALASLGIYLFIKTERKILMGIFGAALIFGLSHIVSDEWTSRMDTINSADDDASFVGRLVAWKLSFILAVQNPFFGGGFKSLEFFPVWSALSQEFFSYQWFYTADAVPNPAIPRAAHSIYFQVMGDHGFFGLAIFLACLIGAFFKANRLARKVRRLNGPSWISSLATMLQLSIFAYALGGAALSFAYFELFYAIVALLIVVETRTLPAELGKSVPLSVTQKFSRQ